MKPKKVSESVATMTEMVMPNDTNPLHNLMGGNLMRWMDVVASISAGKHCEAHVVTASVDHVSFHKPIALGDIVTLNARVTRAFNTSVEIFVEVFAADIKGGNPRKCNHAYFTFVAIEDETRKPKPVPEVIPLNWRGGKTVRKCSPPQGGSLGTERSYEARRGIRAKGTVPELCTE
jgi:acyl-CoA hydrolase